MDDCGLECGFHLQCNIYEKVCILLSDGVQMWNENYKTLVLVAQIHT